MIPYPRLSYYGVKLLYHRLEVDLHLVEDVDGLDDLAFTRALATAREI